MDLADWFLTSEERGNPFTLLDRRRGAAWSVGNRVRPLITGAAYFAELLGSVRQMRAGDQLMFTDWRGDPDERLEAAVRPSALWMCAPPTGPSGRRDQPVPADDNPETVYAVTGDRVDGVDATITDETGGVVLRVEGGKGVDIVGNPRARLTLRDAAGREVARIRRRRGIRPA